MSATYTQASFTTPANAGASRPTFLASAVARKSYAQVLVEGLQSHLATELGKVATASANAQSAISTAQSNITTLQSGLSTAEGNITSLQTAVSSLDDGVSAIETDVATLQGSTAQNSADIAGNSANIATLQTTSSAHGSDIATLQSNLATQTSRIDNVLSNVDATALDSLTEIVSAFQSADGDLQASINTIASSHTTDITAHDGRLSDLESAMAIIWDAVQPQNP